MLHKTEKSGNSSDSDDSDVAFAYMDFGGVDFGKDDVVHNSVNVAEESNPAAEIADAVENNVRCVNGFADEQEPGKTHSLKKEISHSGAIDALTSPDGAEGDAIHSSTTTPSTSSDDYLLRKRVLSSFTIDLIDSFELGEDDKFLLAVEKKLLLPRPQDETERTNAATVGKLSELKGSNYSFNDIKQLLEMLEEGKYADILGSEIALSIFGNEIENDRSVDDLFGEPSIVELIKRRVLNYFSGEYATKSAFIKCAELEVLGVASLNLFLQLNYTGPSMDRGLKPEEGGDEKHPLEGINPHAMFAELAAKEGETSHTKTELCDVTTTLSTISESIESRAETERMHFLKYSNTSDDFHNSILAELSIDGEWPFQVCCAPYFLLFSRALLSTLSEPTCPFKCWDENNVNAIAKLNDMKAFEITDDLRDFVAAAKCLSGVNLWSARAIVAHRRLIQTRRDDDDGEACPTLWNETAEMFSRCLSSFCEKTAGFEDENRNVHISASVELEWGLAQHHYRKLGRGKKSFNKALSINHLDVEVTGAEGKRTKYQKKATAQYLVRAKPAIAVPYAEINDDAQINTSDKEEGENATTKGANAHIEAQMIKHDDVSDDAILLEKIKFEKDGDNEHYTLSILDQSILLALCLDVKNDNPMDGLTGEQMGGYLARVLNQHDDWMVYATALLERAWLECERTHGRERAILQIQALADQHSNRLTLTQSTFKSVEDDSAPAQERLRNIHGIVYPPRWDMLRDLAERYAKIGIVTSAAEMFEELELWDEVVECYRIAGKESKAEEVVRKRLAEKETPRMYAALGDLSGDPRYFERSIELSRGRFYDAHVALGKFYFEKGELRKALKHFLDGLEIKPLMPNVWFRVGTIGMQLREWDTALRAFSEVVQQEPEEGDAWANVAAIHMHNKNPAEAYPALLESLKQNRNNWRVWATKLYACIDLKKYDEAIQACNQLLDMKARRNAAEGIPPLEERCIRAIIGGVLRNYDTARVSKDEACISSSKRSLLRLRELLDKMESSSKLEPWFYEVSAYFNGQMGWQEDVFNDLMKEYRAMQSAPGWEADPYRIHKMTLLMKDIFQWYLKDGSKESLTKCKFMLSGVAKKIRNYFDPSDPPKELADFDAMIEKLNELLMVFKK